MGRKEIEEEIAYLENELAEAQEEWAITGDGPSGGYMQSLNEELTGWHAALVSVED